MTKNIEVVKQAKLSGIIISSVGYQYWILGEKNIFKIWIAKKKGEFTKSIKNEREISILYIRSILEQSREVWFSSLTEENALELERVQEADIRLYLGEKYENFEDGLKNHLYHICKESST